MATSPHANPPIYRMTFTEDGHAIVDSGSLTVQLESSYVIEDVAITHAFGSTLSAELADLIDIALAVYVADRVSRRRPYHADRSLLNWARQFDLTIPVRDVYRWRDRELYQSLVQLLRFLTEDEWHIRFVRRHGGHRLAESQRTLFPMPPEAPVTAALFSGGLDSLAGLYSELSTHPRGSVVLLSASTNTRIRAKQQGLARRVRERSGREIIPVNVSLTLWRGERPYHDDERSQRSRGFLFGVLGAATAILAGTDRIASYENGIGAINLPYTPAQLGTHNTRSAHPATLMQLGALISQATGREFAFRAPFLYSTKAELCQRAAESGLGPDICETASCDSFPRRLPGKPQCGLCTSCLLRRQALYAAGLDCFDAAEQYAIDVVSHAGLVANDRLRPLRMMLAQVESFRHAVGCEDPWRGLVQQHPELWEVLVDLQAQGRDFVSVRQSLTDLYRRYCNEWERFPLTQAYGYVVPGRAVS